MSIITTVPDGRAINPDALPKSFRYNSDSTLDHVEVTDGNQRYRQTHTYDSAGRVVATSAWEKQTQMLGTE